MPKLKPQPGTLKKSDEKLVAAHLRKRLAANSTGRQLGFKLVKATRGRVILGMKIDARHLQIHGVVHGGVLAALADTAGGLASFMACSLGTRVATVEMKINYLEGVGRGRLTADARVVRIGRHLAVVDCDVTNNTNDKKPKLLVAKALMTFFVGSFPAQTTAKPRPAES
jgi:uncharacterized protein (TIGR00369 family)